MPTPKDQLNRANPTDLPANLSRLLDTNGLGFGDMLAAMRPRFRIRTGLSSSATQVHDAAELLVSVEAVAGTPLAIITGGTPGAGEVSVDYDAVTGVPTIEFAGAVTTYRTTGMGALPQALDAALDTTV